MPYQIIQHMKIYTLLACHFLGDYALQIDYIAKTKGSNWWHLFAHCILYSVPFALAFGVDWRLYIIIVFHFMVDTLKARYKKIGYVTDQTLHLITMLIYLLY